MDNSWHPGDDEPFAKTLDKFARKSKLPPSAPSKELDDTVRVMATLLVLALMVLAIIIVVGLTWVMFEWAFL